MLDFKVIGFKNEINLTIKNTKHLKRFDKQSHYSLTLIET